MGQVPERGGVYIHIVRMRTFVDGMDGMGRGTKTGRWIDDAQQ